MANKSTRRGVGQPAFEPTEADRNFVTAMAGCRMTHDEISLVIRNPATGKPISKDTLTKHFAKELADGKSKLKAVIATRYLERLNAGHWDAIVFGFRHIFGWRENDLGISLGGGGDGSTAAIQVTFVKPAHADDD